MNNPFTWNIVNPSICYGRDTLIHDLINGLAGNPRYSFGLAGGRRMGKTTLLRRIQHDLKRRTERWRESGFLVIPVYVDGLTLSRPPVANDIWELVIRGLHARLRYQSDTVVQPDFEDFKSVVSTTFCDIEEQPRVVVLFDEIEPFLGYEWADAFLSHWRALLSNTPGLSECFTAVFAGARELDVLRHDVGSPLKDILEWRSLRCLAYEDACRLMQEPIDQQWDCAFRRYVYQETGGHPMLLQYIMQQVCESLSEVRDRSSMEPLAERASEKFARERRWQFAEWWERYCSPGAQRVYARLYDADGEVGLRTLVHEFGLDEANEAVEILQHVGLVEERDEGFSFCCGGAMFQRWYAHYGSLADAPLHDPELYGRLRTLREELADKYLSAWRIYQSKMPNYSGAVGELRDTLTLLLDIIAPIASVQAEEGFRFEQNQNRATRRQRVRYAARRQHNRDRAREIASDYDLVNTLSDSLAQMVTGSYGRASGQTHTTATREQAYRALKQWEGIFAQLTPARRDEMEI